MFNGVKKFEIEPAFVLFDSDEILEVKVSLSNDSENEVIKIVLRGSDDVKLINIHASDVEWICLENLKR